MGTSVGLEWRRSSVAQQIVLEIEGRTNFWVENMQYPHMKIKNNESSFRSSYVNWPKVLPNTPKT